MVIWMARPGNVPAGTGKTAPSARRLTDSDSRECHRTPEACRTLAGPQKHAPTCCTDDLNPVNPRSSPSDFGFARLGSSFAVHQAPACQAALRLQWRLQVPIGVRSCTSGHLHGTGFMGCRAGVGACGRGHDVVEHGLAHRPGARQRGHPMTQAVDISPIAGRQKAEVHFGKISAQCAVPPSSSSCCLPCSGKRWRWRTRARR
jgi:hypothetical protein